MKTYVTFMKNQGVSMAGQSENGVRYTEAKYEKICFSCEKPYFPKVGSYKSTKFCSSTCYYKKQAEYLKERGVYKGGYNRETYIITWLIARGEKDFNAPCHWCGTPLAPNNYNLDHVIPRSKCKTREEMTNIDNLVVSCKSCNSLKSSKKAEDFEIILNANKEVESV